MRSLSLLLCLLPAACAAADAGPSLQRRPVEDRPLGDPAPRPAPVAPAGPELTGRIAALRAQAMAAHQEFLALAPDAQAAGAASSAAGSEAWIRAQQLLSQLEGRRGPTVAALAEIDSLIIETLARGNGAGIAELEAAQAELGRLTAAQDAAIAEIRVRLAG